MLWKRTLLVPMVCALVVCCGARNGYADLVKATEHFDKGTRLYQVGEYAQALEEFKAGHIAEPDPSFIYNIAQCHRQLGHTKEAAVIYRRFLALDPTTSLHADVERKIAELEGQIRKDAGTIASAAPSQPPLPVNSVTAGVGPGQTGGPSAPVASERRSSRWPLWVGGALTLAFAGSAIALGQMTNTDYDNLHRTCGRGSDSGAGCPEDQIDKIKRRALMVNALWAATGVTAVATGVGLYLGRDEKVVSVSIAF